MSGKHGQRVDGIHRSSDDEADLQHLDQLHPISRCSRWGAANGLQDSTVKALVADLVEPGRRATAYGVFAAIQGAAAIVGGAAAGFLYERSLSVLITAVAATQLAAAILLSIRVGRHKIQ